MTFKYFVYYIKKGPYDSSGYGNAIIDWPYRLNNEQEIRDIEEYIARRTHCCRVALTNFILLKEEVKEQDR